MSLAMLEGVRRRFGERTVLDRLSLAVDEGEAVAIVGRSGCGKSTLLRLLAGLDRPDGGRVAIGGKPVTGPRPEVAVVFQEPRLLPWLSVIDNVAIGLGGGTPGPGGRAEAERALARVGLAEAAGRLPKTLSGGMAQRVGIARALVRRPRLLLMDEPFSALDPLIRDRLQDELLELQQRLHKTIIFVSHDLDEALKIGNTIAIMEGGRIIQAGTPETIVTRPATDYVRNFVANVNPLNVLKLGTLMRPAASLARDGGALQLDPRIRLTARLDGDGVLGEVDGAGLPLRLAREIEPFTDGAKPLDWLLVASADMPMRLAIDAVRMSGWPVLVADEAGRLQGVVGIDELLEALRRRAG
jgi:glycine betaine/proline transport system ATP-binding protein